jgi:hypothetical protein
MASARGWLPELGMERMGTFGRQKGMIALAVIASGLAMAPSLAQVRGPSPIHPAQDSQGDNRFVFHEVDEGILRLDTRLGEMSLCSRQNTGWTCRIVPDERSALDAEMARLQRENADLHNALAALGQHERPGAGPTDSTRNPDRPANPEPKAQAENKPSEPLIKLPTAADLERTREVVATIWRRLLEMMANLREDLRDKG